MGETWGTQREPTLAIALKIIIMLFRYAIPYTHLSITHSFLLLTTFVKPFCILLLDCFVFRPSDILFLEDPTSTSPLCLWLQIQTMLTSATIGQNFHYHTCSQKHSKAYIAYSTTST